MDQALILSLQGDSRYVRVSGDFSTEEMSLIPEDTIALSLESCCIDDDDLRDLSQLSVLRCLDLDSTAITDRALRIIASLPLLEELWLECTQVTDTGMQYLHGCQALRFVSVAYTNVSVIGVDALKAAIPSLEISQ